MRDEKKRHSVAATSFARSASARLAPARRWQRRWFRLQRPTARTMMKSARRATRKPNDVKAYYRVNRYPG